MDEDKLYGYYAVGVVAIILSLMFYGMLSLFFIHQVNCRPDGTYQGDVEIDGVKHGVCLNKTKTAFNHINGKVVAVDPKQEYYTIPYFKKNLVIKIFDALAIAAYVIFFVFMANIILHVR